MAPSTVTKDGDAGSTHSEFSNASVEWFAPDKAALSRLLAYSSFSLSSLRRFNPVVSGVEATAVEIVGPNFVPSSPSETASRTVFLGPFWMFTFVVLAS